jgi:hypothetical protein
MKRTSCRKLMALTLAACLFQPMAWAESGASAISTATSVATQQLEVPAPVLKEAVNGQLDLKMLADGDAHVEMTYPAIADGDTVGMRWTGKTVYNAKVQTVGATRPLVFIIPKATVAESLGLKARLTGSVGVGDNSLVISAPLDVDVVDTTPPPDLGDLPAPIVPAAANNEIDVGGLGANVVVNVAYPSLAKGHKVGVHWKGVAPYNTAIQTAVNASPLKFNVPRASVLPDLNNTAQVTYTAEMPGAAPKDSEAQPINVVLGDFPAPSLPEAAGGELDVGRMGANAVFKVTYPSFGTGHKVTLQWAGKTTFDTPVQTTSTTNPLTFNVPRATVAGDLDNTATVTYSVTVPGVPAQTSEPLPVKVVLAELPAPELPAAPTGSLDITRLGINTIANVTYPSFGAGHKVSLHWKGVSAYDSPVQTTAATNPLVFNLPRAAVARELDKTAELTYTLDITGMPLQTSLPLAVQVTSSELTLPPPTLAHLQGGVIDIGKYPGNLTATVAYPDIHPGHKVGVRWKGKGEYSTATQTVASGKSLTFSVPATALKNDVNGSGTLEYAVDIDGAVQRVSELLPLKVISTVSRGQKVVDDLNARFFDTRNVCENNKPSYYCNGITLRGTESGSWDPWDPSPTAKRKGSQSFSYIRTDGRITQLWRRSGYILLSQAEAQSQGKPVEYLCAYPHDAYTDLAGRPAFGCGLQTRSSQQLIEVLAANPELATLLQDNPDKLERLRNNQTLESISMDDPALDELLKAAPELIKLLQQNSQEVDEWTRSENAQWVEPSTAGAQLADPSTCSGKNAITPSTWNAYTSRLTQRYYQCSLSTANAAQFDTNLRARGYSMPASIFSGWNELLIKVWATGNAARLPLQAFYYNSRSTDSLSDARTYQLKYRSRTGSWLPIVLFNLTPAAGKVPFAYYPEDQAVQP